MNGNDLLNQCIQLKERLKKKHAQTSFGEYNSGIGRIVELH